MLTKVRAPAAASGLATLLAAAALASSAAAQQAITDSATGQAAPAAPGAAAAGGVATPETAQPGQAYVAGTEGDWQIRCLKAPEGPDPCQIHQLLKDSQGNAVAEMTLFDLPGDQQAAMGGSIIVPLETLLTAEVTLQVDDGPARTYPFAFCTAQGCVASIGLTEAEVAEMRAGTAASIAVVPAQAPDQRVTVTASLMGFTAASRRVAMPAE
jgi:invasion protein IalB